MRCATVLLAAVAVAAAASGRAHGDAGAAAGSASQAPRAGRPHAGAEDVHPGPSPGGTANGPAGSAVNAPADVDRQLAALTASLPACEAGRAHCLGLQLHVTVDAGAVIAKPDWLAAQLAAAERHFASIDAGFTVVGADALPASAARIATRAERDAVSAGRVTGPLIHVFITGRLDDVDVADGVIRGVTWHVRGSERKYIILSTAAPDRVLAHELGHVFGLPHSSYAISIMNKTERAVPPIDQRTFADPEIAAMRPVLQRLLREGVLADLPR